MVIFKHLITMVAAVVMLGCSTASQEPSKVMNFEDQSGSIFSYESDATGFNTRTYFYDNGEQVVVFDTQFTAGTARDFLKFIRSKTSNPITHAVITHPNPDKFNGLSVFRDLGATIIASEKTSTAMPEVHEYKKHYFVNIAKMFTDETYPQLASVDQTFAQALDLKLNNGDVIQLRELAEPGVSSNQTVAYIPKANALLVGDLIHYKTHAWLEGGIVNGKPIPTLSSWISDLEDLRQIYNAKNPTVFGGRGKAARLKEAVREQIMYLRNADKIVTDYITAIPNIAELEGAQAQDHYKKIESRFAKQFPDYSLPYMISYGVYGLVNQKLEHAP